MVPYKALTLLGFLVGWGSGLASGQVVTVSDPKTSTLGVEAHSYSMVEGRQGDLYGTYVDLKNNLFVTTCKTDCQQQKNWQRVKLSQSNLENNTARIQVDPSGGLHLVQLQGGAYFPLSATYWSCAADCMKPGRWKSTQLTHSQGPVSFGVLEDQLNHDWFTLDNQGKPRFMIVNATFTFGAKNEMDSRISEHVVYAACDQNCHTASSWSFTPVAPASWSATQISNGALRFDSQNRPHFVAAIENRLTYLTCTASCDQAGNWRSAVIPAPVTKYHLGSRGSDLAVAANGTLYVPFTFENDPGKPAQLWLYSCLQSCTVPASWKQVKLSEHPTFPRGIRESGAAPAIRVTGNKVVLSFLAVPPGQNHFGQLYVMSCTQSCHDAKGQWTSRLAYSSAALKFPNEGVYEYMYTTLETKAMLPSGRVAFLATPHWGVLYTRLLEVPGQSVKRESASDIKWLPTPQMVK